MARHLGELIRSAAARLPDHDAVVMDGRRLSYAALDVLASRFARSLRRRGVGRGERVGLWLPKSHAAIAGLYGAMRCGAAYVPVDPGAPAARFAAIARDAGCAAVLVSADRLAAAVQALAGLDCVRAIWVADAPRRGGAQMVNNRSVTGGDAAVEPAADPTAPRRGAFEVVLWAEVEAETDAAAGMQPHSDDLAYVLYTSGSTGAPKGVIHTHASALAFVEWAAAEFDLTSEDRVSNHAPFHFDLSTFDLFASALAGASVYPVPPRAAIFPAAIAQLYAGERLTVLYETPSALALLLSRGGLAACDLSSLRVLLFAGETMPPPLLRELMALAPRARFANLYGPTETNVCTWYEVTAVPPDDRSIPIGVPCSGDEVHVLDDSLQPAVRGEIGELWVTGASVMRGYWGDPGYTTGVLRALEVGGRTVLAYGTGDLVSWSEAGQLLFHGRRDHQVKTRGYRVELGEIEFALRSHVAVAEAVVLALADLEIGNRLEALVVLKGPAGPAALKAHCARTLPRYMIPELIEHRDSLPRTAGGKVDRAALAAELAARKDPR